uniref:Uncharacterized protein n=1 Tax=Haptolina ericina TaxID=156174 RepID=A0A7S3ALR6_9EUKA
MLNCVPLLLSWSPVQHTRSGVLGMSTLAQSMLQCQRWAIIGDVLNQQKPASEVVACLRDAGGLMYAHARKSRAQMSISQRRQNYTFDQSKGQDGYTAQAAY